MHSWSSYPLIRRKQDTIKSIIFSKYKCNGEKFSYFSCYGTLPS